MMELRIGLIIGGNYKLVKKYSQFREDYYGTNIKTGEDVLIKFESIK